MVYKADTLSLFILDYHIVESEIFVKEGEYWKNDAWDKAMKEYDVLARYDLSLGDMSSFRDDDGVITLYYPPTPAMKDVKMWPPYEEVIKNAEALGAR